MSNTRILRLYAHFSVDVKTFFICDLKNLIFEVFSFYIQDDKLLKT